MAEREALEREIEQLQNLIKDHKRVHGDAPSGSAPWFSSRQGLGRGRGYNQPYIQSHSSQTQPYSSHPASQWKNTYSVNHKTTRAPGGGSSTFSKTNLQKCQHVSPVVSVTDSHMGSSKLDGVSKTSLKDVAKAQTGKGSAVSLQNTAATKSLISGDSVPATNATRTVLESISSKTKIVIKSSADITESSFLTDCRQIDFEKKTQVNPTSKNASATSTSFDSLSKETCAFNKNSSTLMQVKPHFTSSISTDRTVVMGSTTKDISSTQTLSPRACSISASNIKPKSDSAAWLQAASSPHKRSQFTWVKNQRTGISQSKPDTDTVKSPSNSASTSTASVGIANMKQVHVSSKKVHRRLSLSLGAPKTSKYSWVSSSCSTTTAAKIAPAKLPNKQPSPKTLKVPGKLSKEGTEGIKKLTCTPTLSKRTKASGGTSTPQVSHLSRYRWKAASHNTSVDSCGSTPRSSRKGSVYRWTAQKVGKDAGLGLLPSRHHLSPTSLASSGFKLRSRTKIIRRGSSSGPAPERRSSLGVVTVRSRYSLRRRTHTPVRIPVCARRGQSRALVSFGRHKLRRLSSSTPTTAPWPTRTASPSVRNPAFQRVIKTRYKIDTRRANLQHHNPALSYRVKRIQSARTLLQSRLRSPPERQWRGRGMRWIGGALYRVSANKLSRTHPTSTSLIRSGKWVSPHEVSSSCSVVKTSSTQHVASRVVQRSLAIIRQARQKKQQAKQYCMYYNRFGKCNRGNACPYIHDPDKVAVCTRFLRGTCKQTDGKCPFSHKVSKDKMPVCSYFLKGICNNSSCPYSHVYVSRKAAVCQDFIMGYCPQGEKCKKKHTLVCPEFSRTGVCPKGAKCKLQHRQRAKHTGSSLSSGPAKKTRTRDSAKRPELDMTESTQAEEDTPSSGLAKLPSFISLSSSPDTPETTDSPPFPTVEGTEPTGRKLHIKPRF